MVKGHMIRDASIGKKYGQLVMESAKNFVTDNKDITQTFNLITGYPL